MNRSAASVIDSLRPHGGAFRRKSAAYVGYIAPAFETTGRTGALTSNYCAAGFQHA